MRSSFRLIRIFGIDIKLHVTFLLFLVFFYAVLGPKGIALILGVFLCVTIHELCHSLAALHFGIKVKKITLLPIGGIASMSEIPRNPYQELMISLAGPMSNILILVIFYYPLRTFLGTTNFMYPFMSIIGRAQFTGQFSIMAYVYWLNLVLAAFNLLPAFPMDGGRVVRALLSYKMGYKKATEVAVRMGHIFALLFAYIGIVHGHIFLLIIAVFVYMSASSEGLQVKVSETIRNYSVKDVLGREFTAVSPSDSLGRVLEMVLHTHQEDYPVVKDGRMVGFLTKRGFIEGLHVKGKEAFVSDIMRTDIPAVAINAKLHDVRKLMQKYNTRALPVAQKERVIGTVTIDDIDRVYMISSEEM